MSPSRSASGEVYGTVAGFCRVEPSSTSSRCRSFAACVTPLRSVGWNSRPSAETVTSP
ncbi:hypothetical protein [Actinomadura alba]|uniref:Uncharacterized protein n=1 Tax=Actinomadura alba TaxID=406431 RepID=A0ABR7LYT7_9ACTN|nr:hypothetical protein [Actinomadura alba]MBC6470014.1 hypothetical protein [Actinomadura alba]